MQRKIISLILSEYWVHLSYYYPVLDLVILISGSVVWVVEYQLIKKWKLSHLKTEPLYRTQSIFLSINIGGTDMKAYMTVITNETYLKGVIVLAKSLIRVKSKFDLYVLVPYGKSEFFSKKMQKDLKIHVIETGTVDIPKNVDEKSYWKDTLFKLKVFSMTDFQKIVFLDSDMVVFKNIDHLFDKESISAVTAGVVLHKDWNQLNSGIMVITPNIEDYLGMIKLIQPTFEMRRSLHLGFGDQDVIKAYFSHWIEEKEKHLPESYNCMVGYAELLIKKGIINGLNDIYVYHFTGKEKPWRGIKEVTIVALKMIKRNKRVFNSADLMCLSKYLEILKN